MTSGNGWFEAGSSLGLEASPEPGWRIVAWNGTGNGSYSGDQNPITISVDGPIHETAVAYPGLTIAATDGGAVSYSYGNVTGLVPGGSTQTIYVPPGSEVHLTASPSFLHTFLDWEDGAKGNGATAAVEVDSPLRVTARFDVAGQSVVFILLSAAAGISATAAVWILRRRKRGAAKVPSKRDN